MKIGLMLTDSCNFQCKHCMVDSTPELRIADDLVINRFYEIVEFNKPDTVCIVGGEPLLFLDKVEEIVNTVKPYCRDILVYSNGTFLLDSTTRKRVESLGVSVRISKTVYHKDFWTDEIEELINNSKYWKVDLLDKDMKVFPRGRALTNNIYKDQPSYCSLVNQVYTGSWHNGRFLIMQDGSVNIWCPCMSLELANVFTDDIITHDLLVERERILRTYLLSVNMIHDSMHFMCNEVCNRFRVTKDGIYRDGELMKSFDTLL